MARSKGKGKAKKNAAVTELELLVYPIVEIEFPDPLFACAAHPTKPWIALGLATGHVYMTEYDPEALELEAELAKAAAKYNTALVSGTSTKWWACVDLPAPSDQPHLTSLWKTRRHKGACRHIVFDPLDEGASIYTVGSDHVIKKAESATGKVTAKIDVKPHFVTDADAVTRLCASPVLPIVVVGTEAGHVLVFDNKLTKLQYTVEAAHDDAVNAILAMPAVSNYHFLTLGLTTLSHIDIRKGIVTQLDDQSDELLAMAFPSDFVRENKNDTVLVAHGEGIVTIWKQLKNRLMDQLSRIKLSKGVSVDTIISTMNNDDEGANPPVDCMWCGDSEGLLYKVNYKRGRVVETRVHSFADEVGYLDIDCGYRLVSAGMERLKVWLVKEPEEIREAEEAAGDDDDDDDSSDDDGDSASSDDDSEASDVSGSDVDGSDDSGDDNDNDSDDSDSDGEGEKEKQPPAKRARKEVTVKQLRNAQRHQPGISRFDDL